MFVVIIIVVVVVVIIIIIIIIIVVVAKFADIKVVVRPAGSKIMGRLRSRVNKQVRL